MSPLCFRLWLASLMMLNNLRTQAIRLYTMETMGTLVEPRLLRSHLAVGRQQGAEEELVAAHLLALQETL